MKRVIAAEILARSVADDLFATEAAIDAAMTQIAGLTCRLPAAHREAGFAATRGQSVYDSLVEALAAQTRARSAVVDVHNHLAALKQTSGMRTVAIGGGTKEGGPQEPVKPIGRLAVVARAG